MELTAEGNWTYFGENLQKPGSDIVSFLEEKAEVTEEKRKKRAFFQRNFDITLEYTCTN